MEQDSEAGIIVNADMIAQFTKRTGPVPGNLLKLQAPNSITWPI